MNKLFLKSRCLYQRSLPARLGSPSSSREDIKESSSSTLPSSSSPAKEFRKDLMEKIQGIDNIPREVSEADMATLDKIFKRHMELSGGPDKENDGDG